MAYRQVKKQKKDRIKLPEFQTRTIVVWGLSEEQKQAAFVRDIIQLHAKIEKITIIKRKPAIKVKFKTVEDAIRIRSCRKIFKNFPNIYLKYGKDGKTTSVAPSRHDEDVDTLSSLADSFHLSTQADVEVEDDLEQMSVSGMSERGQLMKKLQIHSQMQKSMQDEMETASFISEKMGPPPPATAVAESNRIRLEEILAEEIIDNELMATSSANVVVKCRFAILTPASWLSWIKAHLGVGPENEVHLNKDESKIFIRMFTLAQGRQIDDAFDGVLLVQPGDQKPEFEHAKGLSEIIFHVPTAACPAGEDNSTCLANFRNALRQAFSKFSSSM